MIIFKSKLSNLFLGCVLLLAIGCGGSEPEPDQPIIEPTPYVTLAAGQQTSISASPDGDEFTISFSTNMAWTIEISYGTTSDGWLSVSPLSGKAGDITCIVSASRNESGAKRIGVVCISAGGVSKSINISQDSSSYLIGENQVADIGYEGGTVSYSLSYSGEVSMTIDSDWISLLESKSVGTIAYSFSIAPNNGEARTGHVRFTCGSSSLSLTVRQSEFKSVFFLSIQSAKIEAAGGNIEVAVTSNIAYHYSTNVSWIREIGTRSTETSTHSFQVDPNPDPTERSGVIVFCNDQNVCIPVSVTQAAGSETLEVQETEISCSCDSDVRIINVLSNSSWSASSDASWCRVSETKFTGDAGLKVDIDNNISSYPRTALLTIALSSGKISKSIIVKQTGAAVRLDVPVNSKTVEYDAGSVDISILSNARWTVTSESSWCRLSSISGENDGTVTVYYDENESIDNREAVIRFSTEDLSVIRQYTLTQKGSLSRLSVSPSSIEFGYTGSGSTILLTSNSPWHLTSDASWITFSKSSGQGDSQVIVTAETNLTIIPRSASIVAATDDGHVTRIISVTQNGSPQLLELPVTSKTCDNLASSFDIEVSSNAPWNVNADASWCTVSPHSGNGDGKVSVSVTENGNPYARGVKIIFSTENGQISKVFNLIQSAGIPKVEVNRSEMKFGHDGGKDNIVIQSNCDWSVSSDTDWCSPSAESGTGDDIIEITVSRNRDIQPRSATLYIKSADGSAVQVVSVKQDAAPVSLSLSEYSLEIKYGSYSSTITVTSNSTWSVESDQPAWCTVKKNALRGSINISVNENTTGKNRTAYITVTTDVGSVSKTLTLLQHAKSGNENWEQGDEIEWK